MEMLVAYSSDDDDISASNGKDLVSSKRKHTEYNSLSKRTCTGAASMGLDKSNEHSADAPGLKDWQPPNLLTGESKVCSNAVAARLYQGRTLAFPRVEGQYATLVMLPVQFTSAQLEALASLLANLQQLVPGLTSLLPSLPPTQPSRAGAPRPMQRSSSLQTSGFQHTPASRVAAVAEGVAQLPHLQSTPGSLLHISLSRTVPMAFSKKDVLLVGLKDAFQKAAKPFRLGLEVSAQQSPPLTQEHQQHQQQGKIAELEGVGVPRYGVGNNPTLTTAPPGHDSDPCDASSIQGSGAHAPGAPCSSHARSGQPVLSGIVALTNDDSTRTFVCVEVCQGRQAVCHLIRAVDRVFTLHGLQRFYENPQPHLSVAWVIGNKKKELEEAFSHLADAHSGTRHEGSNTAAINTPSEGSGNMRQLFNAEWDVKEAVCRVGIKEHVVWKSG